MSPSRSAGYRHRDSTCMANGSACTDQASLALLGKVAAQPAATATVKPVGTTNRILIHHAAGTNCRCWDSDRAEFMAPQRRAFRFCHCP